MPGRDAVDAGIRQPEPPTVRHAEILALNTEDYYRLKVTSLGQHPSPSR